MIVGAEVELEVVAAVTVIQWHGHVEDLGLVLLEARCVHTGGGAGACATYDRVVPAGGITVVTLHAGFVVAVSKQDKHCQMIITVH